MPLPFTTLVPVYKTHFIEELLDCLRAQTEQCFSVIFSDDSPSQDMADILADIHADDPIRFAYEVIPGPRLGPASNCYHLFTAWNHRSPYVHYFLDDDLIAPDFYAQHLNTLQTTGAKICISARDQVEESGAIQVVGQAPSWLPHSNASTIPLDSQHCLKNIVPLCRNSLGELSCATFHAPTLGAVLKGGLHQLPYYGLNDLGIFLELLQHEAGVYLPQRLGAFRKNRLQTTGDSRSTIYHSTIISWASLALDAFQLGHLNAEQTEQCLSKVAQSLDNLLPQNPSLAAMADLFQQPRADLQQFRLSFGQAWLGQLAQIPDYIHARSPLIRAQLAPFPAA